MRNVIKKLKEYSEKIDLKKRFNFKFDISDEIFDTSEKKQLHDTKNSFEQNVKLKWILSKKYKTNSSQNNLDFWLVNDWGGIRGFKKNPQNVEKIQSFKQQLSAKKLSSSNFSTISSLSKIASFINPENFVIYDSRVIYSLNWLILTCENQNEFKEKYFPIPSGRNKVIQDFDLKTIINISHLSEYEKETKLFISVQTAYFDFCDFLKTATKEIYGKDARPYELEMLLFTLMDEIFLDIKKRIQITTHESPHPAPSKSPRPDPTKPLEFLQ